MDFLINLLMSVTVVAIFSSIILTIVDEQNSQREIVKIACGMLMVVVILNGFNNGFSADLSSFENFYSDYEQISSDAQITYNEIEMDIVQSEVESLIFDEFSVNCTVYFNENYEITQVLVPDDSQISEISQFLGISENLVEYIESR